MSETPAFILALFAGVLLGVFFFGGLWWTIRKGISSPRPVIWFFGSLLLRTVVALAGFFFVSQGDWRKLLVCLAGFFLVRVPMMRLGRGPAEKTGRTGEGGDP
jgi:F1F0 ATPase subunit 2